MRQHLFIYCSLEMTEFAQSSARQPELRQPPRGYCWHPGWWLRRTGEEAAPGLCHAMGKATSPAQPCSGTVVCLLPTLCCRGSRGGAAWGAALPLHHLPARPLPPFYLRFTGRGEESLTGWVCTDAFWPCHRRFSPVLLFP